MAHNQSENGRDKTTDESRDMTRRTEDPVHHGATKATTKNGTHDTTRMGYGTRGTTGTGNGSHGKTTGPTGFAATTAGGHGFPIIHCSESSSSSEDDGKENLPGGNSDHKDPTNTPPINTHEKKGTEEKIEEKLPGTGGHSDGHI